MSSEQEFILTGAMKKSGENIGHKNIKIQAYLKEYWTQITSSGHAGGLAFGWLNSLHLSHMFSSKCCWKFIGNVCLIPKFS